MPRRGELVLGGRLLCYRVYECADGFVSMGALEPKFWAAFCRGVGREDLIAHQFDAPGSDAHGEVAAVLRRARAPSGRRSTPSTTAAWSRCWSSTRSCATSRCARAA